MISGISDGPGISWDESPDEEPPEEMSPEAELEESFSLALGLQPARLAAGGGAEGTQGVQHQGGAQQEREFSFHVDHPF